MSYVEINFTELEFYEKLGGGAAGSVYRGQWKNKTVAIKKLLVLEKEAEVLSSLSHRNIVLFFGAVTIEPNYCLVTEYAELGSLYDYLRKNAIDYHQILLWAKQIALGMNYLHNEAPLPVIHRDLKSSNVVIAMDLTAKTQISLVGTFPWMAPEVIQHQPVTPACDVFSYSVVLWELLTCEVPFKGLQGLRVAWLVVAKEERLTIPKSCPPSFANLMERCWAAKPQSRMTFRQILDVLDKMLNNDSLKEEIDKFLLKKDIWKGEIENKLENLKTVEKDLTNKQQELDKREKDLAEREKELKQHTTHHRNSTEISQHMLAPHDINGWTQKDVADWVRSIGLTELDQYADLFIKNNVTGRRLFLLTGDDLLQIGILSVGHRRELLDEITKLKKENYRLLNFPPLPTTSKKSFSQLPLASSTSSQYKQEPLKIFFGCIQRNESRHPKWKIIVEFDGSRTALNSIKEVTFIYSRTMPPDKESVSQPPFVSPSWIKKPVNEPIECIISYKDSNPKETNYIFLLQETNVMEELSVTLDIKQFPSTENMCSPSSSTSSLNLKGIWADRNSLFYIPNDQDQDDDQQLPPDPLSWSISSTNSSILSSPISPQSTVSSTSSTPSYKGQPLQGAWAKSGLSGADILKKPAPLPPLSRGGVKSPVNNLSDSRQYFEKQKSFSSEVSGRERGQYIRKQQINESRGRRTPGGSSNRRNDMDYLRSVSDNSYADRSSKQGGRKRTGSHPSSEPVSGGHTNRKN